MKRLVPLLTMLCSACSGGGATGGLIPSAAVQSAPAQAPERSAESVKAAVTPTHYWILQGSAATAMATNPASIAFFGQPGMTVLFPAGMTAPANWNVILYETFTSYASFVKAVSGSTFDKHTRAVMYDDESWSFTPADERAAPAAYTQRFAALAHSHGLLMISAPATDLFASPIGNYGTYVSSAFATSVAPSVDFYDIQGQGTENYIPKFEPFVQQVAAQIKAAAPNVHILAGVSTRGATASQLTTSIMDVASVVDGYWLNIPQASAYDPNGGTFDPTIALQAIAALPNPAP